MPEIAKLEPPHHGAICFEKLEKDARMAPADTPATACPQPSTPSASDDSQPTPNAYLAADVPDDVPADATSAIATQPPLSAQTIADAAIASAPEDTSDEAPNDAADTPTDKPAQVEGIVVALAPNVFEVVVGDTTYMCVIRGRLRKQRPHTPPPSSPVGVRRTGTPSARHAPGGRVTASGESRAGNDRRDPRQRGRANEGVAAQVADDASDGEEAARPTRVAPGDRVLVTPLGPGEGVIEDILPRRTTLARMRSEVGSEQIMMANVTLAALVFAVAEPPPNIGLLDRYLALCEHAGVRALICLNKVDLGLTDEARDLIALYEGLAYPVLQVSAATGEGLNDLRAWLTGQVALLTGPSGVGKSSLMNRLIPGAGQRTGEISEATGKGRHTTTGARLLPFPGGGWLADTAGIRELALWQTPADELAHSFVELREIADDCEYEDCAHTPNEEGCAIQAALASGRLAPSRYASFMRLLGEAREGERPAWE